MTKNPDANDLKHQLEAFVDYATNKCKGDEKGEAHVFCDRFFQAFGHLGYKEAGATLEERIHRKNKSIQYADLVWAPRLLLEMKKRGENLERHYDQIFEYWIQLVGRRPKYVILCNFDEFWIYDFNNQLHEPVDKLHINDLVKRRSALNFMLPDEEAPNFDNNKVKVTRDAAEMVASAFHSMIKRGEERERAQRFILQCVVSFFAEDIDLLPQDLFVTLLEACPKGKHSFNILGGLFEQMNTKKPARDGLYKGVPHFNGGLFSTIDPIELTPDEHQALTWAALQDWSMVEPPIFGTLFEQSMGSEPRHAQGAHFTNDAEIKKVLLPILETPYRDRIAASKITELKAILTELATLQILDPACGSGNFLYNAYRIMKRLEAEVIAKIYQQHPTHRDVIQQTSRISLFQFHGIDNNSFAVELAKVTLMVAKKLAIDEIYKLIESQQLGWDQERALPLDNLDDNIKCADALFCDWPQADFIIGNPPYQSKNKMQEEFGRAYVNGVRGHFPAVPGRADYCVYWFRKAHDHLAPNGRAGLVGTNTIRENYSREGGLDYITKNGGTIVEAVSSQPWPGEASVHVSIVDWIKGDYAPKKRLWFYNEIKEEWHAVLLEKIPPTLSDRTDVTEAKVLRINRYSNKCFQGQCPGHKKLLLSPVDAQKMFNANRKNSEVIVPIVTGENLFTSKPPGPKRFIIDFSPMSILQAQKYKEPFQYIEKEILPFREKNANDEALENKSVLDKNPKAKVNWHHKNFLNKWWHPAYARGDLKLEIAKLQRYIVCVRHIKRPIFEFIDSKIHSNDSLVAFAFEDDYSFGILQSSVHWAWFIAKGSTITERFRYTSESVFDTFPWPQNVTEKDAMIVAKAARELWTTRHDLIKQHNISLRDLYRSLDMPGSHPLKDAHAKLDKEVRRIYGIKKNDDVLGFLFALNADLHEQEEQGKALAGPGLPVSVKNPKLFTTSNCIQ